MIYGIFNQLYLNVTAECIKWRIPCKIWLHLDLTKGGKLLLRLQGNVKPLAVRFMVHLKAWIHLMRKRNTWRSVLWIKH